MTRPPLLSGPPRGSKENSGRISSRGAAAVQPSGAVTDGRGPAAAASAAELGRGPASRAVPARTRSVNLRRRIVVRTSIVAPLPYRVGRPGGRLHRSYGGAGRDAMTLLTRS